MAINIQNDAVKAIVELRGNRDFERLVEALELIAQKFVYAALTSPVELRVEQTAHARGILDLIDAVVITLNGKPQSQQMRPAPKNRREFVE